MFRLRKGHFENSITRNHMVINGHIIWDTVLNKKKKKEEIIHMLRPIQHFNKEITTNRP